MSQTSSRSRVKRCTFTLPEADEALIDHIQDLANRMGLTTPSRSEAVRAALKHLAWANERRFRSAFESLERIKTGRPPSTGQNPGETGSNGPQGA
jgi:hypothetical protein